MERVERERTLSHKEHIVVIDNETDQTILANVEGIKGHIQEEESGDIVFVKSLDGRSFEFSTLIKLGRGKFTSRDNRYVFYRACLLDPKDPQDQEIILRAIKTFPQSLNGNGSHTNSDQNGHLMS
ncbi:MAG: hypothetical protein Q8P92_04080 [Candidatus Daviesbacteria bacterium]|nr:hypothetical protein [Candidatus Daviesbacteria bacterium]